MTLKFNLPTSPIREIDVFASILSTTSATIQWERYYPDLTDLTEVNITMYFNSCSWQVILISTGSVLMISS